MSKRPTPETDAARHDLSDYGSPVPCSWGDWVPVDVAERLERERDEARAERDILRLNSLGTIQLNIPVTTDLGYDKLADTLRTDAYQYADYILNHYDRNSHMDKLCLAKSLVENGYGSKAAEIEAL